MKVKVVYFDAYNATLFNNIEAGRNYNVWKNAEGVDSFYDSVGNVRLVDTFGSHINKIHDDGELIRTVKSVSPLSIKKEEPKVEFTIKEALELIKKTVGDGRIVIGSNSYIFEHEMLGCNEIELDTAEATIEVMNAFKTIDKYYA